MATGTCKKCEREDVQVAYDHYHDAAPFWVCVETVGCKIEVARLAAETEAAHMAARSPELAERMAELGYGAFSDILWMPCKASMRDGKLGKQHDMTRTIRKYRSMFGGEDQFEAFVCGCPADYVTMFREA